MVFPNYLKIEAKLSQKGKKKKSIAVFDFDVKIDWTERYTDCGLTLHFVIHFSF